MYDIGLEHRFDVTRSGVEEDPWADTRQGQTHVNYGYEISKAIAAHGQWKQRLVLAIARGTSELTVGQVQSDTRCEFGRWFHALPEALRETDQGKRIRVLHAAFHTEAGAILELALGGQAARAEKALETGGAFNRLSGQLVIALTQWKQELDGTAA